MLLLMKDKHNSEKKKWTKHTHVHKEWCMVRTWSRSKDVDYSCNILSTNRTISKPFATFGTRHHVATFQQNAIYGRVHAYSAYVFLWVIHFHLFCTGLCWLWLGWTISYSAFLYCWNWNHLKTRISFQLLINMH